MKLILADNQDMTRWGLTTLAQKHLSSPQIVEAQTLKDIIAHLSEGQADDERVLVVTDYTLMNCTEEELFIVHERFPSAQFILFSDQLSRDFIRRMIYRSRRFSILLKDCQLNEIIEGLRLCAVGEQFICQRVTNWLHTDENIRPERTALTTTEREILKALTMGKTTKDIAAERYLSTYTVMTHRKNIFRKLGVNNVQEAIRYALRAGIVDPVDYYI